MTPNSSYDGIGKKILCFHLDFAEQGDAVGVSVLVRSRFLMIRILINDALPFPGFFLYRKKALK